MNEIELWFEVVHLLRNRKKNDFFFNDSLLMKLTAAFYHTNYYVTSVQVSFAYDCETRCRRILLLLLVPSMPLLLLNSWLIWNIVRFELNYLQVEIINSLCSAGSCTLSLALSSTECNMNWDQIIHCKIFIKLEIQNVHCTHTHTFLTLVFSSPILGFIYRYVSHWQKHRYFPTWLLFLKFISFKVVI